MKNAILVSCKKATELISKQQETKINFFEKVQLAIHSGICKSCKMFKVQTKYFISQIKPEHKEHTLSEIKKTAIQSQITNPS